MQRRVKECTKPDCEYRVYAKGLCGSCHREAYPPKPRKPFNAKTGAPLRRTPPKAAKPAARARKRPAVDDVPAEVRTLALERSDGLCEACGHHLFGGVHLHHRQRRRDGGHTLDNLVVLHADCHVSAPQSVHQRVAWARGRGLIVPTWAAPADTPLVMASGLRVRLCPTAATYLPADSGVQDAA